MTAAALCVKMFCVAGVNAPGYNVLDWLPHRKANAQSVATSAPMAVANAAAHADFR
jgi:hypothetical protein